MSSKSDILQPRYLDDPTDEVQAAGNQYVDWFRALPDDVHSVFDRREDMYFALWECRYELPPCRCKLVLGLERGKVAVRDGLAGKI